MTKLLEQTAILEKLAQILHEEGNYQYESVECNFESYGEWPDETAITTLYISNNGIKQNIGMSDKNIFEAAELAISLRASMKAHTGGEWESFTLTLNKDGKAHTKFYYPEAATRQ